jgi:hypothetical protein
MMTCERINRYKRELNYFIIQICKFISIMLIILVSTMLLFNSLIEQKFPYNVLYNYQIEKIHNVPSHQTAFIGDSSLGNCISAKLYSELSETPTQNYALTGVHGFAGIYNLLKHLHKQNQDLKNVVLMSSIQVWTREPSYLGYWRTMDTLNDFYELTPTQKWKLVRARINEIVLSIFSPLGSLKTYFRVKSNSLTIENDYVKQIYEHEQSILLGRSGYEIEQINPGRYLFLEKITKYAKTHQLNLIYVHGPMFENVVNSSTDYIAKVNQKLEKTGIKLIPEITKLKESEVGDNLHHVHPRYKDRFTQYYFNIIQKY